MRCALLTNPRAGSGGAAQIAGAVLERFRRVCDTELRTASSPADMARVARDAVADGVDFLGVLGGDGLAHLAVQACAESATTLVVVPTGTGNDLARSLRIPLDPFAAAHLASKLMARQVAGAVEPTRIDLGRMHGGDWFATVLCAGFDAVVNARVNRMRWPRGPRRYDLAVVRELAALRSTPLRCEAGGEVLELDATLVAVGNTRHYGAGIPVCPEASCQDGLLDVTVLGKASRLDLVRFFPQLRSGRHLEREGVHSLRASSVRLGGDNGWFAFADGEPQAALPLELSCVPGALRVLAPSSLD